jgi:Rrf2 family transcriptional regulator, cysteine metabolism repressor
MAMKISYKGDYALKALFELALRYEQDNRRPVPITEIAKFGDMPKKFLEQILLTLVRGGFVKSRRGSGGGFILARQPAELTIGEVLRYVEGPIEPIACVNDEYKGCRDVKGCILRSVWKEVAGAISIVIDTLTFEELILRYREKELHTNASYEYVI